MNSNILPIDKPEEQRPEYLSWKDLEQTAKSVTWLWDSWIPNGFLTMIVGAPSSGKSYFTLSLVRVLLGGGDWPDGTKHEKPGPDTEVLWIETEGGEAMNRERATTLGIDLARITTIHTPETLGQPIDFAKSEQLLHMIERAKHSRTALVVIDSLSGGHTVNENESASGKIVQSIAQIATASGKPVLLVHHTNKASFKTTEPHMADARGSGSQLQYPRVILNVDEPAVDGLRRVTCTKNNLREKPGPVGFRFSKEGISWCEAPFPDSAGAKVAEQRRLRDAEIQRLHAEGKSQREIAQAIYDLLGISCSVGTVNSVLKQYSNGSQPGMFS